jgi:hypothetical protein
VPKLGAHPGKSAICREDANFGTPQGCAGVRKALDGVQDALDLVLIERDVLELAGEVAG